jgi:hypothetical protein
MACSSRLRARRPDPAPKSPSAGGRPFRDPWTLSFAVLPLAVGDSSKPLGTLNLRNGTRR